MHLGCSIYPESHSLKEMESYLTLLQKYDVNRVFLSLLQVDVTNESLYHQYLLLIKMIKDRGMQVVADLNPQKIQEFGWESNLIEKVSQVGIDIIRLDDAPSLEYIVNLTRNSQNIKVEINASTKKELLPSLLEAGANQSNIISSHNFYPRMYTGLSLDHFIAMTAFMHQYEIGTAAFINSQHAKEGPWPMSEGLCTLEIHRFQSAVTQAKFYKLFGGIDTLIIANQFVSEVELKEIREVLDNPISFKVAVKEKVSKTEMSVIQFPHSYRGDVSDYLIRSSQPRIAYIQETIPPIYQDKVTCKGDILICNDLYKRYKGELGISLCEFYVGEKTNIVGSIIQEEHYLLDYLQPWQAFGFEVVNIAK